MKNLFIGIDFAKEKFDAAVICAVGLEEFGGRRFGTFDNNGKGFRSFLKWVRLNAMDCPQEQWLFCGENTGAYSVALSKLLYTKGLEIWLANAYDIKHSSGLVRGKSDKADAAMIAAYAWRHQDKAVPFEPLSPELAELREVFLYRHHVVKQRSAMMVRGRMKDELGERSQAMSFIRRNTKHIIEELDAVVERCDRQMKAIIDRHPELQENYNIITSVKGVAMQNAACLIVYTNNFKRFNYDARKIACYYGVAPFARDSGTSVHTPAHTSPFANSLIKSLLSQAANSARVFCPEMAAYYERMIRNGKKKPVAINNVKNKLLHIITAMVRDKKHYSTRADISDKTPNAAHLYTTY